MGGRERRREGHPGGAELELKFYVLKLNWFHFCFISIFFVCVCVCVFQTKKKNDSCAFTHTFQNSEKKNQRRLV